MSLSEFDLIREFFAPATAARSDVLLGIGDDCALLKPPPGLSLAVSIDTLVEGTHFVAGVNPAALGHKALAVNLSDLAAMGAEPAWVTLSLTLPQADRGWLRGFADGFAALAATHGVQLVGGDTTRGPLSITVQVHGFVDPPQALRRSAGRPGDRLFVSGTLGDAALALQRAGMALPVDDFLQQRLDRPTPRVALGRRLAGVARAAIDISDGLVADLGHLCDASGVGARLDLASIPRSAAVAAETGQGNWRPVLSGGDDYELLFSVESARVDEVLRACRGLDEQVKEIGCLVDEPGITLVYPDGSVSQEVPHGFDHFRS